jgi:hypothetical protein
MRKVIRRSERRSERRRREEKEREKNNEFSGHYVCLAARLQRHPGSACTLLDQQSQRRSELTFEVLTPQQSSLD